jgi:succinate dehydrogenase hydrophobic anchor subunit
MLYFTIILVNIIISAVIANSAKSREISQTNAFIVSFLLSPLVGMFVVAMSPVRKETLESETVMDIDYPQEDGVVNFMSNYLGNIIWIVFVIFIIYQLFHTTGEQPIM